MKTDHNLSGEVRPLVHELDAVAGGMYHSSWVKCLDGKMMFVGNLDLGGGVTVVTSWKDDGQGVKTTIVGL